MYNIKPYNIFKFKIISSEYVSKVISTLDNNKSTGLDGISVKVLKAGSPVLSKLLAIIMKKKCSC